VLNTGVLNAIAFLVIVFAGFIMSSLFDNVKQLVSDPGFVYSLVLVTYLLIFVVYFSYILVTLRYLFYLNQTKNTKTYFNTMLVFFILASLSSQFFTGESFDFINKTFLTVSVLLIIFNSIRISWIAFLSKKEKIYLLILSIVISVLFSVNLGNTSDTIHSQVLNSFSPAAEKFLSIVMLYGAIYFFVLFFTTLFHLPTAEAFDRKAQEVSSLQYFSKLITEVLDFRELAETVTDITARVSNSGAAWIIWKENDRFTTLANKNIGFFDSERLNTIILSKIDFAELKSTKTISLAEKMSKDKSAEKFGLLSVSPLRTQGAVKGLLIAAKPYGIIFSADDISAIETFSDYASVAIENSRLLEESIEKERLEKELDVAREIQTKILPSKVPDFDNLEISAVFIPAFEVGGDYYDFFEINKNKLGFVIADVSGKGISAAFIMAEIKGIFESLSKTINRPKEILAKANEILKNTLDSRTFVSAALGFIDIRERKICFARAGHCPILLLRNDNVQKIKPSGMGLGLSSTEYFILNMEEFEIDLQPGDAIVLYTDGITDAKNEKLEDFGEFHFKKLLTENSNIGAGELSNKIIKEVTLFSQNHSQYDDITLVIFKWKQNLN
jgi:serine phosphatase RsbU (regulator of sigma subunit)